MYCEACRRKGSKDRCPNKSLVGLRFCGKHVKSKKVSIWSEVNDLKTPAIKITKIWRGYSIRKRLDLAGPGVLNRKICHNDEELVSMEEKTQLHPLEYFSFKENDKIWWFDIRSILSCFRTNLIPSNPYTRKPLDLETRHRLRELYKFRLRHKLPTYHEASQKKTVNDLIEYQWMRVCQNLHENGFEGDITPRTICSLSKTQLFLAMTYFLRDATELIYERPKCLTRRKYLRRIERDYYFFFQAPSAHLLFSTLLLSIFNDTVEPYPYAFIFMSSLFRL